jgi:hypothetical protein
LAATEIFTPIVKANIRVVKQNSQEATVNLSEDECGIFWKVTSNLSENECILLYSVRLLFACDTLDPQWALHKFTIDKNRHQDLTSKMAASYANVARIRITIPECILLFDALTVCLPTPTRVKIY